MGLADSLVHYQRACLIQRDELEKCGELVGIQKKALTTCESTFTVCWQKDTTHNAITANDSVYIKKCEEKVADLEEATYWQKYVGIATFVLGVIIGYTAH